MIESQCRGIERDATYITALHVLKYVLQTVFLNSETEGFDTELSNIRESTGSKSGTVTHSEYS
jgi:hypothetical protein